MPQDNRDARTATASATPQENDVEVTPTAGAGFTVSDILDYGMSLLGTPYLWGGKSVSQGGLDCSGLVSTIYAKFGIDLSGGSSQQAGMGKAVSASDAAPGDLIFFDVSSKRPGIDHVGIYLGNGLMLVSPHSGAQVRVEQVNLANAAKITRVVPPEVGFGRVEQLPSGPAYTPGVRPQGSSLAGVRTDGGDSAGPGQRKPLTKDEIKAAAIRDYGYLAAYLDHPEIGPIILKAAQDGWDGAMLQGALSKTKWYKTNSADVRKWDALSKNDPDEYRAQLAAAQAQVRLLTAQMGVNLNDRQINDLATKIKRHGWSMAQVNQAIADQFHYANGVTPHGQAGTVVESLKKTASAYLTKLSDPTIQSWASRILAGTDGEAEFRAYLTDQAKNRFTDPNMHAALDRGQTVEQYAEPYKQWAAALLELNPEQIDLNDPTYLKMLDQVDPKTGAHYSMTISQAQDYLRSTEAYGKTKQARAAGAGLGGQLLTTLAKVKL